MPSQINPWPIAHASVLVTWIFDMLAGWWWRTSEFFMVHDSSVPITITFLEIVLPALDVLFSLGRIKFPEIVCELLRVLKASSNKCSGRVSSTEKPIRSFRPVYVRCTGHIINRAIDSNIYGKQTVSSVVECQLIKSQINILSVDTILQVSWVDPSTFVAPSGG